MRNTIIALTVTLTLALSPAVAAAQTAEETVRVALTDLFIKGDITAIDRYWSPDYIQHNPQVKNGSAVIRKIFGNMHDDFRYEIGMIIANENLVAVHGRYTGFGPKPKIAVDIYRVEGGKIVEHWDVLQDEVLETASGNPMFTPVN